MSSITIPESLLGSFDPSVPARICDNTGRVLGYYTPLQEGTDADYEWAMKHISPEEIQRSEASGPGRPLADVIADLRRKYGT